MSKSDIKIAIINLEYDEWPFIKCLIDVGEPSETIQENMIITVESYIRKLGGKERIKLEQQ